MGSRRKLKPTPGMVRPRSVRLDNGTNWPLPDDAGVDDRESWIARYAPIERVAEHRFHLASIVDAYKALLAMPLDQSREVLRGLKMAMRERDKEAGDG